MVSLFTFVISTASFGKQLLVPLCHLL
ncbi:MAG: hypothetical protein H6Q38_2238, partial [Chloroflexi bacterium]|nr:hypothetical protein [Chloroflexota bacterium]